jgi:hypothetical protein
VRAWFAVLLFIVTGLTACILGDPSLGWDLAVGESVDGGTFLLVTPCQPGLKVIDVAFMISKGGIGRVDDELIWQIHSPEGSLQRRYELGKVPTGFTETVPLQTPNAVDIIAVEVRFKGMDEPSRVAYKETDLDPNDVVTSGHRPITLEDFNDRDPCG